MKRSLKLPLLIALALGSGQALALDLGQIQVKSALGQPLLAEIPVQQATPAELQKLSVQLASGDEFARAGVSAGRPAIPLHFEVVNGDDGHKVIRITSQAVVNDPFLDLLVEINGGAGKSVREFTILLDPPGSNPAPVAARSAAPSRPTAPATHAAAPARAAGDQVASGQFGPVQRGQTLSAVARRTAPAGVDVNQMMLALKQANPDAFYRDNINALKAGAVLRVPDKAASEAVAVAAAAAQVRQQNGDWRNARVSGSPVTVADAGTRGSTSSSPTAAAAPKGDHLALVPAAKQGAKAAAAGNSDQGAASKQDLMRSQEALASLQQQSDNLKSRLKDLTDINSKNERLLALKDNEIAELQTKLAAARKAAGLPAGAAPAAKAAAATAGSVASAAADTAKMATAPAASAASPAVAGTAVAPAASTPAAEAAASSPAQTTPVKPATITPSHPAGAGPWYAQLWAQALGGATIVLLLLLALLGRRRGRKGGSGAPKSAPSLADRFTPVALAAGDAAAAGDDADQTHLLDQLAEHPDDIGLHLELVSLYYERRDVEHFEAAAEAMHAHVTDPQQEEWQEVLHMGEDLTPAHPLFSGHAAEAVPAEPAAGFDIDQFHAVDVAAPEPAAAPTAPPPFPADPVKVSEYNFNFDLTPAMDAAAAAPAVHAEEPVVAVEPPAALDSGWHFDEPATPATGATQDIETFNDDPVDTKLDLARAYLDMGDPEGARAMLDEVMQEGSQMQRDVAKRMLDDLH